MKIKTISRRPADCDLGVAVQAASRGIPAGRQHRPALPKAAPRRSEQEGSARKLAPDEELVHLLH